MKRNIILIASAAILFVSCASPQKLAEKRMEVAEAVASRRVHINITSMNASRYGGRPVSPDFFLELRGDTLNSYLPYFGQAYRAPMGSPSVGLNFEAPMLTYKESRLKKNLTRIETKVRTQEDEYRYMIDVYDTGEAYIRVTSQYRDPISFEGRLE
jgi:hypothetical protein